MRPNPRGNKQKQALTQEELKVKMQKKILNMQLKYMKMFGEAPPDQLGPIVQAKNEGQQINEFDNLDSSDDDDFDIITLANSQMNKGMHVLNIRSRSVEKDLDGEMDPQSLYYEWVDLEGEENQMEGGKQ